MLPRAPIAEPAGEVFGELADALAALSPREREALLLVAWEGLDATARGASGGVRSGRVPGAAVPSAPPARRPAATDTGRSAIDRGGTMNPDDPVITRVSATNPVPDPDALTAEQRAAAEALRATIADTAATPRRAERSRRIWRGALAVAGIVPVVIVVILVLGIHHRPSASRGAAAPPELRLPSSATAQTLLLIGSDHRAGEPYQRRQHRRDAARPPGPRRVHDQRAFRAP